ncbi:MULTISPECIES: hypothetical protein [Metallosphaera]|uniref:Uncharacterized protein n=2 Tax=Metallosphaera sedula TaxID=43687 RepID=A4YG89_METS5|nr:MULTISPECIES: hypothetical protein [Metallosphaera]ABP95441.1 hypothetical protein Msed_1282 [Metallosphaera sedula DSM 5348]AIM27426.1 hypothetical protein HA72_1282 [Metallosphaera sedula]AKV83276.1 hypothetical protein MsedE_1303 [Metallosphaera sedula]MCY0861651.1 hypothetical protein [Metallosphaera prunae]WPX05289.1 hypothetical protein SOJ17_001255 [Metallosphaera sedula DSM 5348]
MAITFTVYRLVKKHIDDIIQADAMYIACTGLATYDVLGYLHGDLGMSIISENSGAMLEALDRLKISYRVPGM